MFVHMEHNPLPFVQSAWGETATVLSSVLLSIYGTTPFLLLPHKPTSSSFCAAQTSLFALIGSAPTASAIPMTSATFIQVALLQPIASKTTLEHRKSHPILPYNPAAWESRLHAHNLLVNYPTLSHSLHFSFNLNIPHIVSPQTPSNCPSLLTFREAFNKLLARELLTGRCVGPFSYDKPFSLLGPFQSSPISIIPKSGKPGKFRIIQNYSFPWVPSAAYPNYSINTGVNPDDFPCTLGTFETVCTIICSLPPGSQAATRNIAKAYCTVPLHHSQWPAAVVHLPVSCMVCE